MGRKRFYFINGFKLKNTNKTFHMNQYCLYLQFNFGNLSQYECEVVVSVCFAFKFCRYVLCLVCADQLQ